MDPVILVGSLIAILALAGLAAWLKLGHEPALESEEDARRAADHAIDGFEPVRFGLDAQRRGALLEDRDGRILLLKRHGNHFAGRLLGPETVCNADAGMLSVDCGERRFGPVSMQIADTAYWEDAIDRLNRSSDA